MPSEEMVQLLCINIIVWPLYATSSTVLGITKTEAWTNLYFFFFDSHIMSLYLIDKYNVSMQCQCLPVAYTHRYLLYKHREPFLSLSICLFSFLTGNYFQLVCTGGNHVLNFKSAFDSIIWNFSVQFKSCAYQNHIDISIFAK